MRFFPAVVAVLPALGAAQDFSQYQAQFQNFVGNWASYIPNPGRHDPISALEAKLGSMKLHTLTLDNWRETLYEPVAPTTKTPVEWWVLFSGRNKTCMGRCDGIDQAYNETAAKFAILPGSPRMAYVNCDDQPILCNSWSASVGVLWSLELSPPPAPVDIYAKRLNFTSATSEQLVALKSTKKKESMVLVDSWFHPFNGKATELGLSVPFGWVTWVFGILPNWAFMIIVSFLSRTMMGNRMRNMQERQGGAAPAQ